ncbi:leucine-rich repeat extensin-like protein 3 [Penaeus chinensis]|uniref:leucine-rich repeat extensin-like protein 3 n=1 Tax=Penaeus chinensis TaxID=139456 RepID=UPI001FB75B71|nr:leucine-rich repeat extensin-like protein 3 [Penaeus chinensis]
MTLNSPSFSTGFALNIHTGVCSRVGPRPAEGPDLVRAVLTDPSSAPSACGFGLAREKERPECAARARPAGVTATPYTAATFFTAAVGMLFTNDTATPFTIAPSFAASFSTSATGIPSTAPPVATLFAAADTPFGTLSGNASFSPPPPPLPPLHPPSFPLLLTPPPPPLPASPLLPLPSPPLSLSPLPPPLPPPHSP